MKKLLLATMLLFACGTTSAQVTNLKQAGATSGQIELSWTSPCSPSCTVAAKLDDGSGSFAADANPVIPDLVENSNNPAVRYASLQVGNYHFFVIGTMTLLSDAYGVICLNGDCALQENSNYWVQVTDGSGSVSALMHTAVLPAGITYHNPPAIAAGGRYNYPSPKFVRGSSVIDPGNGIPLYEVTLPNDHGQQNVTTIFASAGTCTNWTSATSMFVLDGVYATYSAATNDTCDLTYGGTGVTLSNAGAAEIDWVQVNMTAHDSNAGAIVDACIISGGACIGPTEQFSLGTTDSTVCLPSCTTGIANWNFWMTQDATFVSGNAGFGVRVWKDATDASTVSIDQVTVQIHTSDTYHTSDNGIFLVCNSNHLVTNSAGTPGAICNFQDQATGGKEMYWISDTGQSHLLGVDQVSGALGTQGTSSIPVDTVINGTNVFAQVTSAISGGKVHLAYCVWPTSGTMYDSDLSGSSPACANVGGTWVDLTPTTVLYDPSSATDSLIDIAMSAIGCQPIPTDGAHEPCLQTSGGTSLFTANQINAGTLASGKVKVQAQKIQDLPAWALVFDISGASPVLESTLTSFGSAEAKWSGAHDLFLPTWSNSIVIMAFAKNLTGTTDGNSAYAVKLVAAVSSAVQTDFCVDSNFPSEADNGDAVTTNWNELQPAAAGDELGIGSEQVGVTAISSPGTCSAGQWDFTVQRGIHGSTAAASYTIGTKLTEQSLNNNNISAAAVLLWDYVHLTHDDFNGSQAQYLFPGPLNTKLTQVCNFVTPCSLNANTYPTPGGSVQGLTSHKGMYNNQEIAENGRMCKNVVSPGDTCNMTFLSATSPFAAMGLNTSNANNWFFSYINSFLQPHPAASQTTTVTPFGSDEDFQNSGGPGICGSGAHGSLILVTGSLFKCTPNNAYGLNVKGGPPILAFDGVRPLLNVSGPAAVIPSDASGNWEFCFVYKAGDCQPGSTVGDIYANAPDLTTTSNCNFTSTTGGESYTAYGTGFCVEQEPDGVNSLQQLRFADADDLLGENRRDISDGITRWGRYFGFSSAEIFSSGKMMLFTAGDWGSNSNINYRSDVLEARLSPWVTLSDPQWDWQWVAVNIPAPRAGLSVATAEVDFGYDLNLHCAGYSDVCAAVNSTANDSSPFQFVTADAGYTRLACASGCTIAVPVIPNRVAFYQVKLYTTGGALAATYPVRATAAM